MTTYNLVIKLESPLAISQQRISNLIPTLSYVPAPTVRGAVASQVARIGASTDREFTDGMVAGGLRFSNMLPVNGAEVVEAMPAPLSMLSCKLNPGLKGEDQAHGLEDSLFINTQYALEPDNPGIMFGLRKCSIPDCGHILKPFRESIERYSDGRYCKGPSPGKRLQAHVGLDRARHGSAPGILYSREVINEVGPDRESPTVLFQASVTGTSDLMNWLTRKLGTDTELLIGNAVSRGLGRCRVLQFNKAPAKTGLEERINRFNEAAAHYINHQGMLLSLTLHTPAFFVDDYLMAKLSPHAVDLLQAAMPDEMQHAKALKTLQKIYQNARPYRLTGWNQLAGFPRTTEMGLQAGSVMVFRTPALTDELIAALAHLEAAGIGLNREAGYGKVSVCDPIHTDLHEITQGAFIQPKPQKA